MENWFLSVGIYFLNKTKMKTNFEYLQLISSSIYIIYKNQVADFGAPKRVTKVKKKHSTD